MKLIGYLIINTIALLVTAYVVPGFSVDSFTTATIAAVVIGIINTFIKPVLTLVTLPITIITLGLFSLILNVFLLLLAARLVEGFDISGFVPAVIGSIVLSVVSWLLNTITK